MSVDAPISARAPLRIDGHGPHDEVAVWTLSRPETRNALDWATLDALTNAIAEAGANRALRAIVLTGEGGAFASGGDLNEHRTGTAPEDAARLSDIGRGVCEGLGQLSVPVLAPTGTGGRWGRELAMACDIRDRKPTRMRFGAQACPNGAHDGMGNTPQGRQHRRARGGLAPAPCVPKVDAPGSTWPGLVDVVTGEAAASNAAIECAREVAKGVSRRGGAQGPLREVLETRRLACTD